MRPTLTFQQIGGPNHIYLASFKDWLASQKMTQNTARVYYSRIKQFLLFLEYAKLSDKPLNDPDEMNKAMVFYLAFLKQSQRGNSTINANVNALKSFAGFLGIGEAQLEREPCYEKSTKMLTLNEQERFLQAADNQESARDKALALVLFYTGLRIGDCARLNMVDINATVSAIVLPSGAGIPLNTQTARAIGDWLEDRQQLPNAGDEPALWLTRQGRRLKISGITYVIERIGWQAGVVISAETLRRTRLAQTADRLSQDELAFHYGGYIAKATIKRYGTGFQSPPLVSS
jgi:integrase